MNKLLKQTLNNIARISVLFIGFVISGSFMELFWTYGFESAFGFGHIKGLEFASMMGFLFLCFGVYRICKRGLP